MATSEPPPFLLSLIDNVVPRRHTCKVFFFAEAPGSDVSAVVDTLRDGLSKTLKTIIQLSGTVQATGQKGGLCVTGPWNTIDDIFLVKDLRSNVGLEYRQLKDEKFPLKDLDKSLIVPTAGIERDEKPVMLVQLSIINGGIIMVLCLHHSFTDANGTVAIVKLWAAYCRGEDGSRLVTQEIIDRKRLTQAWESTTITGFLIGIYYMVVGSLLWRIHTWTQMSRRTAGIPTTHNETAMFFFSKSRLAELKLMASSSERAKDDDVWISTKDALCALIGCCAHSSINEEISATTDRMCSLRVVVNLRRRLRTPLPADYIGNAVGSILVSIPRQSVDSTPAKVAEIAHLVRNQIKQRDERYFRKLIAILKSVPDLATVEDSTGAGPSEDRLSFTSWANLSCYDINWGDVIGTKVERVRYYGFEDLCVIMPEMEGSRFAEDEGGLEVVITLEKGQMGRLKQNEFFMRFAEWRYA